MYFSRKRPWNFIPRLKKTNLNLEGKEKCPRWVNYRILFVTVTISTCLLETGSAPTKWGNMAFHAFASRKTQTADFSPVLSTCQCARCGPDNAPTLNSARPAWLAGHSKGARPQTGPLALGFLFPCTVTGCTQDRYVDQRQRLWIHPAGSREHY